MHEGVEACVGLFMACGGEVQGDHRGVELGVPQGALEESGVDTGFKQMGSVGMALMPSSALAP